MVPHSLQKTQKFRTDTMLSLASSLAKRFLRRLKVASTVQSELTPVLWTVKVKTEISGRLRD